MILLNTGGNLVDSIMGTQWDTFFGQTFDWLVYASFNKILEILEIPIADVIQYGPFFRQKSRGKTRERGVQIDLLIVRKDNVVTVIENKFTREPVGAFIQEEVQAKIEKLEFPKRFTVEKVLISASGATRAVSEGKYFNKIIVLEDLFA